VARAGSRHGAHEHVERFRATMAFSPWTACHAGVGDVVDRTVENWKSQGLRATAPRVRGAEYFGLDPFSSSGSPRRPLHRGLQHHIEGTVAGMDDYLRILPMLYPGHAASAPRCGVGRAAGAREVVVWATLEGSVVPRTLMGIERRSTRSTTSPS